MGTRGRATCARAAAIVLALLGLAIVTFAVIRDWGALLSFPWRPQWPLAFVFLLVHSTALGTLFIAWHRMVRSLANTSNWRFDLHAYSVSILARRIPLPIWYAGSRVLMYRQTEVSASVVMSATVLEAVLIGLSGVLAYVPFIPWYTTIPNIPSWLVVTTLLALGGGLWIRPSLVIDAANLGLRRLRRQEIGATLHRRDLLALVAAYWSTWLVDGAGLYFFVTALTGLRPPLVDILGASTLTALVGLVSMVLPFGLGLKELTLGVLLSAWMPLSAGVILAIAYRVGQTLVEAFWAAIATRWSGGGPGPQAGRDHP